MSNLLKFGQMKNHHLDIIHDWMKVAGWKDDLNQVKAMFTYTPDRWVTAELDGQLVGVGGLRVEPGADHGGIGLTLTAPGFQGKGLAASINRYIDKTYPSVNLSGNAGPKMFHYLKKTFPFLRVSFDIHAVTVRCKNENNLLDFPSLTGYDVELYGKATHFDDLVTFDQKIHITRREEFLDVWLHASTTRTYLVLNKRGDICGYGCLRHLNNDLSRIAPLFAENSDIALAIYDTLMYAAGQGKEKQGRGHVEMALVEKEKTWPVMINHFEVIKQWTLYRADVREKVNYDLSNVYAMTDLCLSYL